MLKSILLVLLTASLQSNPVHVKVTNNHWDDMRVYVQGRSSGLRRLGFVTAHRTEVFTLPATSRGWLWFVGRPMGGRPTETSTEEFATDWSYFEWTINNAHDTDHLEHYRQR